jgi:dephospho-CoA kinase
MPGSWKSEATSYLQSKGYPYLRFGQETEEGLKMAGIPLTPENEQRYRENLRKELGMAAYAIKALPKLKEIAGKHEIVVVDGLYSWEEYVYLREHFQNLNLVYVFARPMVRYARLIHRSIRPLSMQQAYDRDVAEVEKLNKGGPIAMADFIVENNTDDLNSLHHKIEAVMEAITKEKI